MDLYGVSAALIIFAMALVVFIKSNLYICSPNEILIFSGRRRKLEGGRITGYRLVQGRGFRLPLLENVYRLSLENMPLEFEIRNALFAGMVPASIRVSANIKIAGTERDGLHNAVERFLGKNINFILPVAREVIEGNLRGVLATMTPDEANSLRLEFARRVQENSLEDLRSLGLYLDTFKVLDLFDDGGYLESIGRRKNAFVRKDARIAEAEADSEARRTAAEMEKEASVVEAKARVTVAEAENARRVRVAELEAKTGEFEGKVEVAAKIARAEAEKKLEEKNVELNRLRVEGQMLVPARAQKEADELRATGQAAAIFENGKATAEAIRLMRVEWEGGNTRELFLIQQLPDIIEKITSIIADNLSVERLTVVDSGNGVPSLVSGLTGSVTAIFEQIKNTTGLDIPDILSQSSKERDRSIKKELH